MSEFTWCQMLGNWYCWKNNIPVALLKEDHYGFEWWLFTKDVFGKSSKPYSNLESIKLHVQEWYNETYEKIEKQRTIYRYQRKVWQGEPWEDTVYDVYYVDRLTGKVVLEYDGADPANTNPEYGAESDYWKMRKKGMNLEETIPAVLGM